MFNDEIRPDSPGIDPTTSNNTFNSLAKKSTNDPSPAPTVSIRGYPSTESTDSDSLSVTANKKETSDLDSPSSERDETPLSIEEIVPSNEYSEYEDLLKNTLDQDISTVQKYLESIGKMDPKFLKAMDKEITNDISTRELLESSADQIFLKATISEDELNKIVAENETQIPLLQKLQERLNTLEFRVEHERNQPTPEDEIALTEETNTISLPTITEKNENTSKAEEDQEEIPEDLSEEAQNAFTSSLAELKSEVLAEKNTTITEETTTDEPSEARAAFEAMLAQETTLQEKQRIADLDRQIEEELAAIAKNSTSPSILPPIQQKREPLDEEFLSQLDTLYGTDNHNEILNELIASSAKLSQEASDELANLEKAFKSDSITQANNDIEKEFASILDEIENLPDQNTSAITEAQNTIADAINTFTANDRFLTTNFGAGEARANGINNLVKFVDNYSKNNPHTGKIYTFQELFSLNEQINQRLEATFATLKKLRDLPGKRTQESSTIAEALSGHYQQLLYLSEQTAVNNLLPSVPKSFDQKAATQSIRPTEAIAAQNDSKARSNKLSELLAGLRKKRNTTDADDDAFTDNLSQDDQDELDNDDEANSNTNFEEAGDNLPEHFEELYSDDLNNFIRITPSGQNANDFYAYCIAHNTNFKVKDILLDSQESTEAYETFRFYGQEKSTKVSATATGADANATTTSNNTDDLRSQLLDTNIQNREADHIEIRRDKNGTLTVMTSPIESHKELNSKAIEFTIRAAATEAAQTKGGNKPVTLKIDNITAPEATAEALANVLSNPGNLVINKIVLPFDTDRSGTTKECLNKLASLVAKSDAVDTIKAHLNTHKNLLGSYQDYFVKKLDNAVALAKNSEKSHPSPFFRQHQQGGRSDGQPPEPGTK